MKTNFIAVIFLSFSFFLAAQKPFNLHSHNDYQQKVPFWTAFGLEKPTGKISIEADVILRNDTLFVAHEARSVVSERTLAALYLEPLVNVMTSGSYQHIDIQLLIDVKSSAQSSLRAIMAEIEKFPALTQNANPNKKLTFVISGNRPVPADYSNYPAYLFFDHQDLADIQQVDLSKVAMVSLPYTRFSRWNGRGKMLIGEEETLKNAIDLVHLVNKPIRFWGTPDTKTAWSFFNDLGVDFINTDSPFLCNNYLSTYQKQTFSSENRHEIYPAKYPTEFSQTKPQNIILMIGDGNGLAQISAGMYANGNRLNLAQIKQIGLLKTQSADDFVTDSAAGATALATGKKTKNRYIGLDAAGNRAENLMETLQKKGFSTAVVTTDDITGATPAAFFAHSLDRGNEDEIAQQLALSRLSLFAGASNRYVSATDWVATGRVIHHSVAAFSPTTADAQVGLLVKSTADTGDSRNYLPAITEKSLAYLKRQAKPFVILIENGRIDNEGHGNNAAGVAEEVKVFDRAIGEALKFVDDNPNTLLLITADHETGGLVLPHGDSNGSVVEGQFHSDDHSGVMVPIFAYGSAATSFGGIYENTEVYEIVMRLLNQK